MRVNTCRSCRDVPAEKLRRCRGCDGLACVHRSGSVDNRHGAPRDENGRYYVTCTACRS